MRLHLPVSLFRSLFTCFAAVAATTLGSLTAPASASTPEDELLMLLAEQEYPNGRITYTTRQTSALTLKGYESILFKNISSSYIGGAIYNNVSNATFTLSGNGAVTFSGNTAYTGGGAIYNDGSDATFTLSRNESVTFSGNTASTGGGAIYNNGSDATFTLSGNGAVTFSGNETGGFYGGAIYNRGSDATFTLSGNGAVTFSGNTASNGAAIGNNGSDATFTLSGNGAVTFSGNTATYGGAIYNMGSDATFTLSGNGAVTFSGNKAELGAAIWNSGSAGTFTLSRNESVIFRENEGSTVQNWGTLELSGNGAVTFSENNGKAISTIGTFALNNNEHVTFCENNGYAISNSGTFALNNNEHVTFSGNTETSSTFAGGTICNTSGTISLDKNKDVIFSGNTSSSESSAQGSVIFNEGSGTISLGENHTVTFSGNTVEVINDHGTGVALGGAVYNEGIFTLKNNGDVLFEKNAEIVNDTCRLRSIYSAYNGGAALLNLSAEAEHSITFHDSVYADGAVKLNAYGTGDIIFSGATTETDLLDVKGVAPTQKEIRLSRSSEMKSSVTLYGGRLLVEDEAMLQVGSLECYAGSSVSVSHTTLTTTLLDVNELTDCSLYLSQGGSISFAPGSTLILNGVVTLDVSGYSAGSHTLLTTASLIGAENLSIVISAPDKEKYSVAWNAEHTSLSLSVKANPLPPLPHRKEAKSHVWTMGKGVWSRGSFIGDDVFLNGDSIAFQSAAAVTVETTIMVGGVLVDTDANVAWVSSKKIPGSGISGEGTVTKSGAGMLTMNAGNTYSGGTTLNAGTIKATAADSFGTGVITVKGGVLDLGSKAVANDIVLSGTATLKGDAKYAGSVTVAGDATLLAKTSYKGLTTIGSGSSLTLAEKATMAGSIAVDGGRFIITAPKGMTLAKGATMTQDKGGAVRGLLTVGAGSTLVWADGGFETAAPVLKGGTLDLGAENALTLTGSKAQVAFGDKRVELPGKGIVYTDETLTVNGGTVTLNAVSGYESGIEVAGGTLKLSTGKVTTDNEITVSGNAAVVNGKMHFGDITVNGTLAKGTNITIADGKTVQLNGTGVMLGTIAGAGTVDVNASIDATAAKITAAHINLNNGTFTNTKGIKLAKGQTLTLAGAGLDLGPKGALATAAGSTLVVSSATSLTGNLTLGGGELVFAGGTLDVDGMLTLSKAMTVKGSGSITYTTLKPFKGDISVLFGGAEVVQEGNTLTITGEEAVGYRLAPAPLDMTPALPPAPVTNPVADAMVQADWGILDAERAFMGAVNSRHQHAALLDKGRGAAWVSAFGSSVRHGNKGAHHGSDGNIEGAAFGLEHAVSETGSIGLAVGRSKNRLAATGVTHLRQETAHVALYGQKHLAHGFTADAAASYGDTETKLGAASWQQKSAALTARLTHARQLTDATAFRTFGGLAYEATDAGSIGSAHTGSVQNLRAELGAGATHTAGKAHFYAEAALTGDLVRHNPTADLDGTRTHGANPGRIGIRATVGALYEFTDTWSGTASYGIETESRSTSHTFNIGVSKSF